MPDTTNPKVSCVIPAHNEAPRIETVLLAAAKDPLIDEVIVVDDGSTDGTNDVVKKFIDTAKAKNARLITLKKNAGKSNAIYEGITAAQGEFICMLDADLLGLTEEIVSRLIKPVLTGSADISISLRGNSPWIYRKIGIDLLSGDRVFHKSILADRLEKIRRLPGLG